MSKKPKVTGPKSKTKIPNNPKAAAILKRGPGAGPKNPQNYKGGGKGC
jgi:hypothetical protein